MFSSSVRRFLLILALLITVGGTALRVVPAARAAPAGPTISTIIDAKAYGVMLVTGHGFTPNTTAVVDICDSYTDAVLRDVTVKVDRFGNFSKVVSIPVPSGVALRETVTIHVTDASQAVTEDVVVPLRPESAIATQQLPAAQQALAEALKNHASFTEIRLLQATVIELQKAVLQQLGPAPTMTAHAQVAGTTISAIIDATAYGQMSISGHSFTPNTTATIQVRDSATSALLQSVPVKVNRFGNFSKMVSITMPGDAPLVEKVTIRVIDSSQAVSEELALPLGSPTGLVQLHLNAAQKQLTEALKHHASNEAVVGIQAAVIQLQQELIDLLSVPASS